MTGDGANFGPLPGGGFWAGFCSNEGCNVLGCPGDCRADDDPECDLTELPASMCGCPKHRGGDAPDTGGWETVGQPFPARFLGVCARCDRRIHEDTPIVRLADRSGYIHATPCTP